MRPRKRKIRKLKMIDDTLGVLEERLLAGQPYETCHQFVSVNKDVTISTISANTHNTSATPVLCIHGMGGACAMWLLNIEAVAPYRPFYAIDLPGFGRSSRCHFSEDADEIEDQYIDIINLWREKMQLDKFILIGHSFGGYLSTLYAMKYPQHVSHLLLVDPWGYCGRPSNEYLRARLGKVGFFMFTKVVPRFSPFTFPRLLGEKYGSWVLSKVRSDLMEKFSHAEADKEDVSRYIHLCNAQTPASGETSFANLSNGLFWAKNPLLFRTPSLADDLPVTFLYGENTWNSAAVAYLVKQLRCRSYVDVQVIADAGHHLYADQADEFNDVVKSVCQQVDDGRWKR